MPTEHYSDKEYTLQDLKNVRDEANRIFPELCLARTEMYSHEGGALVEGKEGRQWVYFPGKDGPVSYDWALWKIKARLDRFKADMELMG